MFNIVLFILYCFLHVPSSGRQTLKGLYKFTVVLEIATCTFLYVHNKLQRHCNTADSNIYTVLHS
jgi:hypothetical protein